MKKLSLITILEKEEIVTKTWADLDSFLKIAVPYLVKDRIVKTRVLKMCSEVAPLFTYFANKEGFKARTIRSFNHFYNLVELTDGVWMVDLTNIQFKMPCNVYEGDEEYYEELQKLLNQAEKDPFSVVKIQKTEWKTVPEEDEIPIRPRYAEHFRNKMYGIKNTDPDYWLPKD